MKAQIPAEGILKRGEYGDSKSYLIPCSCCGSDCEHNVWVEADSAGVSVTTYVKLKSKWWSQNRFATIWNLLTKGYVEYEASIIMTEQQATNYAETLKTAAKEVKTFRETERGN